MTCVWCAAGGHVSSDTRSCDGCGLPHCDWCLSSDDAGSWCEECSIANRRESLEACGGEALLRVEAALNRLEREAHL